MPCNTARLSPCTIRFIQPPAPNSNVSLVSAASACIVFFGLLRPLKMSSNHLIHAMLTHRGRVRQGNEDTCAANPEIGAYIVCDGMGGAAAGEVASNLAADTFLEYLTSKGSAQSAQPQARLNAAVQAANQAVFQQSRQSAKLFG